MSEFTNARESRMNFRFQLLATVSAIALIGSAHGIGEARAADDDSDRPLIWIELGGQLSRLDDGQEAFAPLLMAGRPSVFTPSQKFENLPLYTLDETGKISFEPDGSTWVLSASVRYGRSGSRRHVHQQSDPKPFIKYSYTSTSGIRHKHQNTAQPIATRFADTNAQVSENHFILDFQAGKDVGLGMFGGKGGSSVFNLGVRFAQFSSKSNIALKSDPDWHFNYKYFPGFGSLPYGQPYHSNAASMAAQRSFHGVGPSLSWTANAPFAGNTQDGELAFDWGVNAALLFGRQKTRTQHQTTERYYQPSHPPKYRHRAVIVYQNMPAAQGRARSVTVPNVGGFAGLSFRIENFKVNAGYRADFFFGPMDGGIDTSKKENVGFYGPFASVSVGLGG